MIMSLFVIVHGAWGSPDEMAPVRAPLLAAGHEVIAVDLPCTTPDATLADYAAAVNAAIPSDGSDVILVAHSFGGFTVSTVAAGRPGIPVVYVAAVIPQAGASLVDIFLGSDPFTDEPDVDAALAAFGGMVKAAEPGCCALDIEAVVSEIDPAEQETNRQYLQATQRSQGIAAMREKWNGTLPTNRSITYVLTTADTLVSPDDQRAMAEALGASIIEIDSDHSVFGEQPEQLAQILAGCAPDGV